MGPARVRVGRQGRGTPGEPAESGSGALAPFRDRQPTRVRLTLVLTSASIAVQEVPFDLAEVKLVAPSIRPGTVAKADVIGRLCTASAPFTTLVAGAGYGKTTLLARWAQADPRPFAWVALDGRDGDAVVLLRYIAAAIHRVEPLSREVFDALSGPGASSWATRVPRIGRALADLKRSLADAKRSGTSFLSRSCRCSPWGGTGDGMIVYWPNGSRAKGRGALAVPSRDRRAATVLDVAGLPGPTYVNGVQQQPLHGVPGG